MTVSESQLAFIGEIVVDDSGDWAEADEMQQHYYDLLAPGHREKNSLLRILDNERHRVAVRRDVDRSDAAWRRFLNHSRPEFAGTGWEGGLLSTVSAGPSDE